MKKKLQLAIPWTMALMMLFSFNSWGQGAILDEPIEPGVAPSGWSYNEISWETADAGYARFDDLTSWLETPVLDLSG